MHPDFLIIGAGALGLSTALELLGLGARVLVLDQGKAGSESTWAGAGILSPLLPWDYGPAVNRLATYSAGLFPAWCESLRADSGVDPEYRSCGMAVLPPVDSARALAWCLDNDLPCDLREAASDRVGCVDTPYLWLPNVAQVRNPRLIAALRGAFLARGGELMEESRIIDLVFRDHRVTGARTERESYSCAACVVAAGAYSALIPGLESIASRVYPVRGQMLLYKFSSDPLGRIVYRDGHYLVPRTDGHLLVGSTQENAGFDKSVTGGARQELRSFAATILPALSAMDPIRHWSGLRPGSPDNIPLICRHPIYQNLFINTGHFRYGVTLAPGSAKALMSMLTPSPSPIALDAYAFPQGLVQKMQ